MTIQNRINRLLSYKQLLNRFKSLGLVRVFSDNIADPLGISASLVRKDFGMFGIAGSQKGGYTIESVLEKINEILGSNEIQKVIIVGVGRIGEAIMSYKGFHKDGINIIAGFDIDVKKMTEKNDIPVLPIEDLPAFIKAEEIKVAIMAVPDIAAQQTFEILKSANIQGILNFSPVKFKSTDEITINNFNIENELINLIYFVNMDKKNGH
ncbi:MAG: redox-sensing transcriptional repressor Rex [Bacteroidales bacterium]|nr:redox-sensing transcriptional repressor Rex [Bacteroidales bacterium]